MDGPVISKGGNACAGGSKNKKLVQLGIDVRYMVILVLWVKIDGFLEGDHGNMDIGWHDEFIHVAEQV